MPIRPETAARHEIQAEDLEQYRRELTGYCYRMLGSFFEAEDAVQETMVRAWRGIENFEGRSALRSWLYRIATNVCLDLLRGRERRAQPMDLGPSSTADATLGPVIAEHAWVQPAPDARVLPNEGDPAELAVARETIRLAFITALQHLPARQRAVLILREVLRWQASEVAELLETSVASVNSALQRARATLATRDVNDLTASGPAVVDASQRELLARYVDAFERYDITSLVTLLHDDAVMSMPPYDLWLRGPAEMGRWFLGQGKGCRGSRLVATAANGSAAFGSYRQGGQGGHQPFALQVIEISGDRIVGHHNFLDPALFAAFGLPARL
ncbi:MAG TPA: sigma-70 family RNA polymerase sigma factor [Pseudonocardiaceae bacterium]|nr:sigma-70 family RNA polymerase sigma factor [Pseudonocardiaceae bacterium]